jgi:hypothetical protein
MPRPLYIAVIAAVILVAGATLLFLTQPQQSGRGIETTPATPPTTETTRDEQTPPAPPTAEGGVVQLTLYLNDYGYNASRGGPTIKAYVNDLVRITLVGNGSGPIIHDFVLDSGSPSPYDVKSNRLSRGQTQVIEFVAAYPGEYKYYCSVKPPSGLSHRDRGQEGTIIILPKS